MDNRRMRRQRKVTTRIVIETHGSSAIKATRELTTDCDTDVTYALGKDTPDQSMIGWSLTQESFDRLLLWLDPDREQAGRKYESIRLRLIKVFSRYGWTTSEDMADESINRVAKKIDFLLTSFVGNQEAYFVAVGQKVHLEHRRLAQKKATAPIAYPLSRSISEDRELVYQRLERCMQRLSPPDRELILQYYQDNKQARIDSRKLLAERLGICQTALRLRAYRIRRALQEMLLQID